MRALLCALPLLLFASPVFAQGIIDGTWKLDPTQGQPPKEPRNYVLKDGTYWCNQCRPKVKIKADGHDHPVSGSPDYDTSSFVVLDPHSYEEVRKKAGRKVWTMNFKISADNQSMTRENWDDESVSEPTTETDLLKRVGSGPAGSAPISGLWQIVKIESYNGAVRTYKTVGDSLNMTASTGQSWSARLDGTEAPYKGAPGDADSISVKKISDRKFDVTIKLASKVVTTSAITVSADGHTMRQDWHDPVHNFSGTDVLVKQ